MKSFGVPDPHYVVARGVLLDALEALGEQREAIIVVGAQAIYLHTGAADLAVPEFTTDADLTIDPALLHESPELGSAMRAAHFERGSRVGCWITYRDITGVRTKVEVDLMVPEAVGGAGRRAARLPGHSREVARKARGLEAALVDKATTTITALDPADQRSVAVAVAGPAALLIAKLHKIAERASERSPRRLDDKDALDILRLLQAIETSQLAEAFLRILEAGSGDGCRSRCHRDPEGPIRRSTGGWVPDGGSCGWRADACRRDCPVLFRACLRSAACAGRPHPGTQVIVRELSVNWCRNNPRNPISGTPKHAFLMGFLGFCWALCRDRLPYESKSRTFESCRAHH